MATTIKNLTFLFQKENALLDCCVHFANTTHEVRNIVIPSTATFMLGILKEDMQLQFISVLGY
jgi:hypothetical protein